MSVKYFEEKTRSGISHKKFKSDFGSKILEKFGWKEGEGLGKNKSGIKETIQIKRREENIGLGKTKKEIMWNDKWWENSYNNILKDIKPIHNEKKERKKSEDKSAKKRKNSNASNGKRERKDSINSINKRERKNSINSVNSNKRSRKNSKDNINTSKNKMLKKKRKITYIDI